MTDAQWSPDETREKLIEAAGEVFAEVGFNNATVREICSRAKTNTAAVNYHFRDKLGLYIEVLKSAMLAQQASPDSRRVEFADSRAALKALIHDWFERMSEGSKRAWFARIMAHEMAHPTPALDRMAEAMESNYLRFRTLVGKMIGCSPSDARTRMCVHSVVGQIVHYTRSRAMIARLWPDLDLDDEEQRCAIADHVVEFSLAGMEGVARDKQRTPGEIDDDVEYFSSGNGKERST